MVHISIFEMVVVAKLNRSIGCSSSPFMIVSAVVTALLPGLYM